MKYRTFSHEDQAAFAELSGDYNPIHIDAVAARRLIFGSPVVHGIHALLWGLNCCLEDRTDDVELRSIKARFPKPIRVNESIGISIENKKDGSLSINLLSEGSVVTAIKVELSKSSQRNSGHLEAGFPQRQEPLVLLDDEIEVDSGALELFLNVESATQMFPHLIRCIPPVQIAVILSTTRLVGSICPGMNSLYSELNLLKSEPNNNPSMTYKVTKLDRRFGLIHMKINAPELTGTITAFRRPEPQKQANCLTLSGETEENEFAGQRALVIGGSRGLGEVAAKLLAAGGADVKFTYYQGEEDAHHIVDDIVSQGGIADCFHFDVLNPRVRPHDVSINKWTPTHLYYFATPFIFSGVKGKFSSRLFETFCDYFVVGFLNTVSLVKDLGTSSIFYPSTVAIDEMPTNMGEYVAAKLAGESLCAYLGKTDRQICIYNPRFPRVSTDQTVSIMPVTNHNPALILMNELRAFRDSSHGN
ncbi:MAG: MaoC/PaaZ C-terminal domain-containing protein [Planctomycetota bacterium]|jgi:acyl dehydratase|nr:MaoC/PaaZ C-terminal domain-containing protein [Planctomycetota bacterium]